MTSDETPTTAPQQQHQPDNNNNSASSHLLALGERVVYPTIVRPSLQAIPSTPTPIRRRLLDAFAQLERVRPGASAQLLMGMFSGSVAVFDQLRLHEATLRAGAAANSDALTRSEPIFQALNRHVDALKHVLGRIPDEIYQRRLFLETIKEIAAAIKRLLDGVHDAFDFVDDEADRQLLDEHKREFVKSSKRFSTALKRFFREADADSVFLSANELIYQTDLIVGVVKRCTE